MNRFSARHGFGSRLIGSAALGVLALVLTSPANATIRTFGLAWDGSVYGNLAMATGQIVIDDALLPNPASGYYGPLAGIGVQSVTVTITGASSGNGTFTTADFSSGFDIGWDTGGATLDLTQNLVGQPTAGAPWGTSDDLNPNIGGDFNLFGSTPGSPTGTWYFRLAANEGNGDAMQLTQFTPIVTDVPEPGVVAFGLVAGGSLLGLVARRRRK